MDLPSLPDLLKARIAAEGALPLETYWNLCLFHPDHGYYRKKDPLGQAGDFVTAPEISQMFGEMIGVWCVSAWRAMGKPPRFHLAECGPGRGTLMADLLRAVKKDVEFLAALRLHMIEINPVLRKKQREALEKYAPAFHDHLSLVPDDAPAIVIGNEFLDTFPILQQIRQDEMWYERRVGWCAQDEEFCYQNGPQLSGSEGGREEGREGDVRESSPERLKVMEGIYDRLRKGGGAALMIDYGYEGPKNGDTFQAVRSHAFTSPLDAPGECDLTSHVDFFPLMTAARERGLSVFLSTQGEFLEGMGLSLRLHTLMKGASEKRKEDLLRQAERLAGPDYMGQLFKVLEVSHV